MRLLFISVFLLTNILFSQEKRNEYLPGDLEGIKNYLKEINDDFVGEIEGKFSAKIKKIFRDKDEKVFKSILDSNYVFNPVIKKNLDYILNKIYKANPEIDTLNYNFFIKNSVVPNAACYGDGMFEINLGLLTQLETEDELAFIICHEISHKLLKHSIKNISNRIAVINSKDTKERIRKIKKNKYGQTRAALSVIDELKTEMLDYSKEVEAEADSLGYVLFSNTNYVKNKAATALKKIEFKDDIIFSYDVKIDSVFNFSSSPFKSYWIKEETSLFDTKKEINEFSLASDTISTHPEIDFRINKLRREFGIDSVLSLGAITYYSEINNIAHKESIKCTIDFKYLDLAMYQLIQKYSVGLISTEYYYVTMAEVLKKVYETKKNHELGKYVPHVNNFSDEKQLNVIRLFLHNLELNEVRKIALVFCKTNMESVKEDENFKAVYNFFNNTKTK